jgi:hypothetical protein
VALATPDAPPALAPGESPDRPTPRSPRPTTAEISRRRTVVAIVGVVLVVAGLVVLRGDGLGLGGGGGAGCAADSKSDADGGPGKSHVTNPTYKVNPPAGGNHLAQAAGPGAYGVDYLPPDGQIVAAMEQGDVVLWYRPDLDLQGLASLQDLAFRHSQNVLTVPRRSLPRKVAATAWHARLLCGSVDLGKLDGFLTAHVDKGPQKGPH